MSQSSTHARAMNPNGKDREDLQEQLSPMEETGGIPVPSELFEPGLERRRAGRRPVAGGQRDRNQDGLGYGPVRHTREGVLARHEGIRGGSSVCGVCILEVPEGRAMKCPWCEGSMHAGRFGRFVWNGWIWKLCHECVETLVEARDQLPRTIWGGEKAERIYPRSRKPNGPFGRWLLVRFFEESGRWREEGARLIV